MENPPKGQVLDVAPIVFIGEQTGVAEKELTEALAEILAQDSSVLAGFLVRVQYGNQVELNVALALWFAEGSDLEPTIEQAGTCFWKMFNEKEKIDVIVLRREQLDRIRKVCRPFFQRQ